MSSPAQNIIGSSEPGVAVPRQPRAPASGDAPPATNATPYALVTNNAGNIPVANTTVFEVLFDTALQDNLGNQFDAATGRLICRQSGVYLVVANFQFQGNATGIRTGDLWVNGSRILAGNAAPGNAAAAVTVNMVACVPLVNGDYINVYAWQNSGAPLNLAAAHSFLSMMRLG
jgi:hypothetical protein